MKKLRINIEAEGGEVFDVLTQDSKGFWYDSDGEEVAQGVHMLTQVALPKILNEASEWSEKL